MIEAFVAILAMYCITIAVMIIGGWLLKFVLGCFDFSLGAWILTQETGLPGDYLMPLFLIIIGIICIVTIIHDRMND